MTCSMKTFLNPRKLERTCTKVFAKVALREMDLRGVTRDLEKSGASGQGSDAQADKRSDAQADKRSDAQAGDGHTVTTFVWGRIHERFNPFVGLQIIAQHPTKHAFTLAVQKPNR